MSKTATQDQLNGAADFALNYIIGVNPDNKLSEQQVYDIAASRSRLILKEWGAAHGVQVFADEINTTTPVGEQIHKKIREVVASVKPQAK